MCLYLQKRSNGVYYFRRTVPAVLHSVVGREHWTFSLDTKKEEAKRLRSRHAVDMDRIIAEAQRRLAEVKALEQDGPTKLDWLSKFAREEADFAARKAAQREARRGGRRHYRVAWRERLSTTATAEATICIGAVKQ